MTEQSFERCTLCDDLTGHAGASDDSLYVGYKFVSFGPLCDDCYHDIRDGILADEGTDAKIATLEAEVETWHCASGLVDSAGYSEGDPAEITPDDLERSRHKELAEVERLRGIVGEAYAEGWSDRETHEDSSYLGEAQRDADWRCSESAEAAKENGDG